MNRTGAISHKHAQVYNKLGFRADVCTDIYEQPPRFGAQWGCEIPFPTYESCCRHPRVDYAMSCNTFPDFRMQPIGSADRRNTFRYNAYLDTVETARRHGRSRGKRGIL